MPFAANADVHIHYERTSSGEPLLLLTGLGGTAAAWSLQRPAFEKRYQVIVLDPRGAGLSTVPTVPYTTTHMAEDAIAVLDSCGAEVSHLLGIGLGGMIAQRMAVGWPHRVGSLVLVSTFARADAHARRLFESWSEMLPRVGWEMLGRSISLWTLTPDFFEKRPESLREIEASFQHNVQSPEAYRAQVEALLAHDSEPELARIHAPTLVVMGEEDIETPIRFASVLIDGIANAELAVVPGTGHRPHVETPELFNTVVLAFLERHSLNMHGGKDPQL